MINTVPVKSCPAWRILKWTPLHEKDLALMKEHQGLVLVMGLLFEENNKEDANIMMDALTFSSSVRKNNPEISWIGQENIEGHPFKRPCLYSDERVMQLFNFYCLIGSPFQGKKKAVSSATVTSKPLCSDTTYHLNEEPFILNENWDINLKKAKE